MALMRHNFAALGSKPAGSGRLACQRDPYAIPLGIGGILPGIAGSLGSGGGALCQPEIAVGVASAEAAGWLQDAHPAQDLVAAETKLFKIIASVARHAASVCEQVADRHLGAGVGLMEAEAWVGVGDTSIPIDRSVTDQRSDHCGGDW